jgi:sugar phosphate isomerase/epimerase
VNRLSFATLNHCPLYGIGDDRGGLRHQLASAAAAGFDGVSIDVFSLRAWQDAGGELLDLGDMLGNLGLACTDLAGLTVSADAGTATKEADWLADVARSAGALWVQMRIVDPLDEWVHQVARACAKRITAAGAGIAVEPSSFTHVSTIEAACELASSLRPIGRAGVVVDSWHFLDGGRSPARDAAWGALAQMSDDDLAFVQFTDAGPPGEDARHDTMHRRALPGRGVLDLDRFVRALNERGFDGWVSVEVLSDELRRLPVREFAEQAETTTRRWFPFDPTADAHAPH